MIEITAGIGVGHMPARTSASKVKVSTPTYAAEPMEGEARQVA
jgi:hypothetical protein